MSENCGHNSYNSIARHVDAVFNQRALWANLWMQKKHNGKKKYLLHSVHMKVNRVVFLSHFVQKRKLTLP